MNLMMELIEWWIFEEGKIMKKTFCDISRLFLTRALDHNYEFGMEELFGKFLMVEVKSFRFPSLFCSFIEDIAIKCHEEFESKDEYFPPSREEKSESFRFKWFESEKKRYLIGSRI